MDYRKHNFEEFSVSPAKLLTMEDFKSFKNIIFNFRPDNFDEIALDLFRYQAVNNQTYRDYIAVLGINPDKVKSLREIPFMPISLFREREIKTGTWKEECVFKSSGTTNENRSRHYVDDLNFYEKVSLSIFEQFYGNVTVYVFLALLPSYQEQGLSSLIHMVQHLILKSGNADSGFYLHNPDELIQKLNSLRINNDKKVILWGVTYALLDFAKQNGSNFEHVIVLETGGMKGKREEKTRNEVHEMLRNGFGVKYIHSEYGMTELLSQSYSSGNGLFKCPSWMRIFLREINDPLSIDNELSYGGVNIIDLANVHSCAFLESADLGRVHSDGSFEIIGRLDNSDARGCNLLLN